MKKTKIIMIAHASHSYFLSDNKQDDLRKITLSDWYARTARQLKKFYPKINVECWCPEKLNKREDQFIDSGIKYRVFPTTFSPVYTLDFSIPLLKALKEEVVKSRKEKYNLAIHLHEYHNLHGLLIATLFKNQKIIGQHHGGSWPLKHLRETKKYRLFFPFFLLGQLWEYIILRNISFYYALSKDEVDYLKKVAPNSKIRFQTMGIEDSYFKQMSRKEARKNLGWPIDKKIVLFLGRINPAKGIGYLIDAMEKLKEVNLKIIGWGNEKEFKNYAESKKLKNVEFLGSIFNEKKLLYLSATDALILPSSKEGAPVTIMEAMARNTPSIASRVGGTPLMIKNMKNGILIRQKNSDDIVEAVKQLYKKPLKDVQRYAKIYKWEKIIHDTVEDYQK